MHWYAGVVLVVLAVLSGCSGGKGFDLRNLGITYSTPGTSYKLPVVVTEGACSGKSDLTVSTFEITVNPAAATATALLRSGNLTATISSATFDASSQAVNVTGTLPIVGGSAAPFTFTGTLNRTANPQNLSGTLDAGCWKKQVILISASTPGVPGTTNGVITGTVFTSALGIPTTNISFSAAAAGGYAGVNLTTAPGTAVVAYLLARDVTPNFAVSAANVQAVIIATSITSAQTIVLADPALAALPGDTGAGIGRTVTLDVAGTSTGGGNQSVVSMVSPATPGGDSFAFGATSATIVYTQKPAVIGQKYYYRLAPVLARRAATAGSGTSVTLLGVPGTSSAASPGLAQVFRPQIVKPGTTPPFNTDNLVVSVQADVAAISGDVRYFAGASTLVSGVRVFRVDISTSAQFPSGNTFTRDVPPPTLVTGLAILNLGDVKVPGYTTGTPIFVRVTSISNSDNGLVGTARDTVAEPNPIGVD